jgi:hypothetical protein
MMEFIAIGIGMTVQWLVYTALLWFMIKIQGLNYNLAGLLGSSLLATLIGQIPLIGPILGWAVLVVCLWKCTGADIAPDVLCTVSIAGALMFCFNLFLLGSLMGELRPDLMVASAQESAIPEEDEENDEADSPARGPSARVPTPEKSFAAAPRELVLKGITVRPSGSMAMVFDGGRLHTISKGEAFLAHTTEGRIKLRCEEITDAGVVLATGNGQKIKLTVD